MRKPPRGRRGAAIRPRIDLAISGAAPPHIDGGKLAEIARTPRPEPKVLFVKGQSEKAAITGRLDILTRIPDRSPDIVCRRL